MPTFKHYNNSGDLIATMAGIKSVCEKIGEPATIYQQLNVRGHYYKGATHPVVFDGQMVMMNQPIFDMMKPLIESQPYIKSFEEFTGQKFSVDIDDIRSKCFVNIPYGMIQSWVMLCFPDMACDLSKRWIEVEPIEDMRDDLIIINFTERYRNDTISYFFLKEYQEKVRFVGTPTEHEKFQEKWNLDIAHLQVKDFLELAKILKKAKFFLGNQSFNWNLANAMGVPRILEMCNYAPNCQPFIGEHNYGFYHQSNLEYFFRLLHDK